MSVHAFDEHGTDEITYNSWVAVDDTTLITITESTDVFVESLLDCLLKLKRQNCIVNCHILVHVQTCTIT